MEYNDKQFIRKVRTTLSKNQLIKGGIKGLYLLLEEEYPSSASERSADRKYMKRFFSWRRINDVLEITEIYGEPIPTDPPKEKKYRDKTDIKGYTDETEFYERAAKVFRPGEVYKGYSEFCSLLNVPKATGEAKINQLKDWERYFVWEKETQKRWKFIGMNASILPSAAADTKSVYGSYASNMLVKGVKEGYAKIRDDHKIHVFQDKQGRILGDIFFKRNDLSEYIGINIKNMDQYEYKHNKMNELIKVNIFWEKFDKYLTSRHIYHTSEDLYYFRKQMHNRLSTVINSATLMLMKKGVIFRQLYTELYYDIDNKYYSALIFNPSYDGSVKACKDMIAKEANFTDWSYINKLPEVTRNEYLQKLNGMIREELGIIVFHGFWMRLDMIALKRFYEENNLSGTDNEAMRNKLKDIIKERQELAAKKVEDNSKYIAGKNSEGSVYSPNYIEISNNLYSSIFQPEKKCQEVCNWFLTAKDDEGNFDPFDGNDIDLRISEHFLPFVSTVYDNIDDYILSETPAES